MMRASPGAYRMMAAPAVGAGVGNVADLGARFGGMENPQYSTYLARAGAGLGAGVGLAGQRWMPEPVRGMGRGAFRHGNLLSGGTGFHLDPSQWHWNQVHPTQRAGQAVQAVGMSPWMPQAVGQTMRYVPHAAAVAAPAAGYGAIERVWEDLHANVTRNHTCKDMPSLMRQVRYYLRKRNRRAGRDCLNEAA
jgi:hypothetical protein